MTKTEKKQKAQDLIMMLLCRIGYIDEYKEFVKAVGNPNEADLILKAQMDRVAKLMGYKSGAVTYRNR